jgi:hypothetical protein
MRSICAILLVLALGLTGCEGGGAGDARHAGPIRQIDGL